MTKASNIYAVCIPITIGVGVMAMLCHIARISLAGHYALSSILMLGILFTVIYGIYRGYASHNAFVWTTLFLFTGAFCYCNAYITGISSQPIALFSEERSEIRSLILGIPFSESRDNAVILALICGDKSLLDGGTLNGFRTAGAAHLLALSGMHLGIIYLIIRRILVVLGNSTASRNARSIITILATGLYTLFCGAGASLVRAWLFIMLNESACILHRKQPPQQIFCTALTLHLILNPLRIGELGFQLSYLAMIGIVFLWPHIRMWMDSKIWEGVSLCISCQIFTGPLSYFYFGTFPVFFLVTNLLAAPLMTVVMLCGITAMAAYAIGIDVMWFYKLCELPIMGLRILMENISAIS